jgi:hypothetical protein
MRWVSRNMSLSEETLKTELLYTFLGNLGNVYPLNIRFDSLDHEILGTFPDKWKQYNPRKEHNPRYGLSLTSLDGQMTGIPDLDSIIEYNKANGTKYTEASFTQPTEALLSIKSIHEPLKNFLPHLGRSHLIRLGEGGFFPFHRDSQHIGVDTFRLISPLLSCAPNEFCFIYDQQKINLESKVLYFMNTKVEHAVFSMNPDALLLVLNIIISEESINLVFDHLLAQ